MGTVVLFERKSFVKALYEMIEMLKKNNLFLVVKNRIIATKKIRLFMYNFPLIFKSRWK